MSKSEKVCCAGTVYGVPARVLLQALCASSLPEGARLRRFLICHGPLRVFTVDPFKFRLTYPGYGETVVIPPCRRLPFPDKFS